MLKGKTAIVTGSTSGIGLGIARALGGAGTHLMLNGFGEAAQIEALRAGFAKEFGVKVAYNGAVITLLAVAGLTHKQSYKDIFAITMIKTAAVFFIIGVYYATGIV